MPALANDPVSAWTRKMTASAAAPTGKRPMIDATRGSLAARIPRSSL
jgi:hypothetical protein